LLQVFATMQSTALWSGSIGCITYTGRPHLNIDMHSWHQKSIELVRGRPWDFRTSTNTLLEGQCVGVCL